MLVPVAAAEVTTIVPVLMLVGGLMILVAGLVLLTGGRLRATGRARSADREVPRSSPWTASSTTSPAPTAPTAPAPPTSDVAPVAGVPACDWVAWFELEDGRRVPLRTPVGRACCTYVVGVRDLDPVTGSVDELEEILAWSGTSTRLGPGGAATRLERDVVTRRASTSVGELFAALSLDRSPGPEVTTPGWRDVPVTDLAATGAHDSRAAQLWSLHIDELRDHGARPVPTDGPRVAPLVHRRRVEAAVAVERGCDTAAHTSQAEGHCRARLGASLAPAAGRLAAPLLASWIQVDDEVAAADEPTVPPVGLSVWQPVAEDPGAGIAAVCDPRWRTSEAEWLGHLRADVDEAALAVTVGSAVRLEADADEDARGRVAAELHASTGARVRVQIGPAGPEVADAGAADAGAADAPMADTGCTRCLPDFELVLGRLGAPGGRPAASGATADAQIRFDDRIFRLLPPVPGSGERSWTVAQRDLDEAGTLPADVHEVPT